MTKLNSKAFEGNEYWREAKFLSRNPNIQKWKNNYIKNNDDCEFCNNIFVWNGKTILQAHHLKPISLYDQKGEYTKEKNIAFICPNCHRFLHKFKNNKELENLKKEEQKKFSKLMIINRINL